MSLILIVALLGMLLAYYLLLEPFFVSPLSKIPGPKLYAVTKWRLALDDWNANRSRSIDQLHRQYGSVVRVGPKEVHFNSLTALRTIYGAGSGYERTSFYQMFDIFGSQMMFTFHSSKQHADRKKMLAHAYSKSSMMKPAQTQLVQEKVRNYLDFIEAREGKPDEIFTSLHYFSIDSITQFVYGKAFGATSAMTGDLAHQALLGDVLDPARRKHFWFMVHLPQLTRWMYSRAGVVERLLQPFLPMQKPEAYAGVCEHASVAWQRFRSAALNGSADALTEPSVMTLLFKHHVSQGGTLEDIDVACECADHFLAGIDTTADTLIFLIWTLSLPLNKEFQQRLVEELRQCPDTMFDETGVPSVEAVDKLEYLNAVIKETLRIYAPLPATEPRTLPRDSTIDGYLIPAGTVVGMSPYSLHRNDEVFADPLRFYPDRWIGKDAKHQDMNRRFWAFSSGGRMCIGLHLAMAEITTLVAALYRRYNTSIAPGFENITPAITSRFEFFYDVTSPHMKEHECWINFSRQLDETKA